MQGHSLELKYDIAFPPPPPPPPHHRSLPVHIMPLATTCARKYGDDGEIRTAACCLRPRRRTESLCFFNTFSREKEIVRASSSSSHSRTLLRRAAFRTTQMCKFMKKPLAMCIMWVPGNSFFRNLHESVFLDGVFRPMHLYLSCLTYLPARLHEYASFPENGAQTPSVCHPQTCRSYVKSSARYGALYVSTNRFQVGNVVQDTRQQAYVVF